MFQLPVWKKNVILKPKHVYITPFQYARLEHLAFLNALSTLQHLKLKKHPTLDKNLNPER